MSDRLHAGVGQPGFVTRHELRAPAEAARAQHVAAQIRDLDLRTVRLVVVDQHGQPRAKALSPEAAITALSSGLDFSGAIYSMDSGNNVFVPPFAAGGGFGISEFSGFPDVVIVPDPATFRILPWADRTGWMLCDAYFGNGQPVPLDTRGLLKRQLAALAGKGYDFVAGLEIEFHVFTLDHGYRRRAQDAGFSPPPPPVSVFQLGYQYLSEVRLDSVADTLEALRDALDALGLPPRSMEDEWGPGQLEFTFAPMAGLAAADNAVLFRSAVKQICQRHGLLATFMCRPGLPNFFSSGWHLHQSLADRESGKNAFATDEADGAAGDALSPLGRGYVAGLLEHAIPALPFASPTVTGYKRYRPYSFAPDRVCWGVENRGVLVRVQGSPGDAGSHVEMRSGEPAANPYLYMASNIAAGLDGITRSLTPPAPVDADPYTVDVPRLPASLAEAVYTLEGDTFYRKAFGDTFIDYLVMLKRAEVKRYEDHLAQLAEAGSPVTDPHATVTDWETREYFEFY